MENLPKVISFEIRRPESALELQDYGPKTGGLYLDFHLCYSHHRLMEDSAPVHSPNSFPQPILQRSSSFLLQK
jgi:hypothetical protein